MDSKKMFELIEELRITIQKAEGELSALQFYVEDKSPCTAAHQILRGSTIADLEEARDKIDVALRVRLVL